MTLFEYLTAGYVLILSFAVVRALSGFPHVLKGATRYWVHFGWLGFTLANCLVSFWAFFSYRDAEWTLLRFAAVLAIPAVIYVYNSILVPSDAASVTSWRDYFFRVRVPLFATGAFLVLVIATTNYVVLGVELPLFSFVATVFWAGIYVAGMVSADERLHAGLVLVAGVILGAMLTLLAPPAPLLEVSR